MRSSHFPPVSGHYLHGRFRHDTHRIPAGLMGLADHLRGGSLGLRIGAGSAAQRLCLSPKRGQAAAQQTRDTTECQAWAKQQTGFDPLTDSAKGAGVDALLGAVGGAATGAAVGAATGRAGTGAAIGAAADRIPPGSPRQTGPVRSLATFDPWSSDPQVRPVKFVFDLQWEARRGPKAVATKAVAGAFTIRWLGAEDSRASAAPVPRGPFSPSRVR
jgi:hypothetical protein